MVAAPSDHDMPSGSFSAAGEKPRPRVGDREHAKTTGSDKFRSLVSEYSDYPFWVSKFFLNLKNRDKRGRPDVW